MRKVIVCHAIEMSPAAIWYPSLQHALQKLGCEVDVLALPTPEAPNVTEWTRTLQEAAEGAAPEDTVLVGHSLGAVTVLRYLQEHMQAKQTPFAGAVLVAAMAHPVGYPLLNPFFEPSLDWELVRTAAAKFRVLIANDDPVLTPNPINHTKIFVEQLGATVTVMPTGGHFPSWGPDLPAVLPALPEALRLVTECLPSLHKA
jgi:predicted alpha/beta hydrolase family esterase